MTKPENPPAGRVAMDEMELAFELYFQYTGLTDTMKPSIRKLWNEGSIDADTCDHYRDKSRAICSKLSAPANGIVELKICKEALWKIAVDYHEDNPDRHINPVSSWEVAEEALKKIGDMKNE